MVKVVPTESGEANTDKVTLHRFPNPIILTPLPGGTELATSFVGCIVGILSLLPDDTIPYRRYSYSSARWY